MRERVQEVQQGGADVDTLAAATLRLLYFVHGEPTHRLSLADATDIIRRLWACRATTGL
jgi:hypothetical protein